MSAPGNAQQPQAPTGPLAHIPVEILLRITSFLSTTDLGNVRLTCRSLEQSLFHFFSHEFFRKKQFMVFTDSLQALIDISKHPALSRVLKHVIIATDGLSEQTLSHLQIQGSNGQVDDTNFFSQGYLAQADQHHLLDSGGLKDMLAEAFRNLPNLDTLDIRDFNSSTRNRDGEGARWTSYGSKTLARRISPMGDGLSLSNCHARHRFPDQIFSAMVAALAAADAHPLQIHINIRSNKSYRQPWDLSDKAFYIPPRLETPLESILGGLTTLHLSLSANDAVYVRDPKSPSPFMLHRFLSLTPNLTWLRLNMSPQPPAQPGAVPPWECVFKWIIDESTQAHAHPSSPYQTQPIRFPKLEQLDIGHVVMAERTLFQLVRRLASSLKTLSLRRVVLLQPQDADSDKATGWAHLIEHIGALHGVDIREINLAFLQDGYSFRRRYGWVKNNVNFVAHGGSTRRITERSFQGTSTPAIVAQILSDILAPIPSAIPPGDSSDDGDSSDGKLEVLQLALSDMS